MILVVFWLTIPRHLYLCGSKQVHKPLGWYRINSCGGCVLPWRVDFACQVVRLWCGFYFPTLCVFAIDCHKEFYCVQYSSLIAWSEVFDCKRALLVDDFQAFTVLWQWLSREKLAKYLYHQVQFKQNEFNFFCDDEIS